MQYCITFQGVIPALDAMLNTYTWICAMSYNMGVFWMMYLNIFVNSTESQKGSTLVLITAWCREATTQIARFMGPTWDLLGSYWPHVGPMNLAIWIAFALANEEANKSILPYCVFRPQWFKLSWTLSHFHNVVVVVRTTDLSISGPNGLVSRGDFRAIIFYLYGSIY